MATTTTTADVCVVILQSTKLSVEKDVCADIAKIVSKRRPEEEVEVRFGYTINNRNLSGFPPEKGREQWYTLLKLLKGSSLYDAPIMEKTLAETYGDLRKITDLQTPSEPLYQVKKKIETLTVFSFKIGDVAHTVRLNHSSEKVRKNVTPTGKPDFSRIRSRVSFASKDGSHRIDLTYVSSAGYEVEIEYLKAVELKVFFEPIKLVMHVLKGEKPLVTVGEYSQAITLFNSFFAKEASFDPTKFYRRGLPQPINLKKEYVPQLAAYAVTNKLNGSRMVAVIANDGEVYLINMVGQVTRIGSGGYQNYRGTVLDTEYFEGIAYAFDLLFEKGSDVRNLNLDKRLSRLQKLVQAINLDSLQAKVFRMSGDISLDTKHTLEMMASFKPEDNDGLIYTPITDPYFNMHIYKWKPPSMLTIDFMAAKIGDGKYLLQVKDKSDKLVAFNAPPLFIGIVESKTPLQGVGEYRWDSKTFQLVRNRPDKDMPNFIDIAKDVWADIQNPITEEALLELLSNVTEERDGIRKYNNSIKRDLIMASLSAPSFEHGRAVLDLGAGKGGDLAKYQAARINTLFAVEPNPLFLVELVSRADDMRDKHRLGFKLESIPDKAQNTAVIQAVLKGRKVNAATSFFSLSFFFENAASVDKLVETLNSTVEKGGVFVGTTIDGEAVRAVLQDTDAVNYGPVRIVKKYGNFTGPIGLGKAIEYTYKNSATVADTQIEYLVDWEMFKAKLSLIGFDLQKSEMFAKVDWLSPEENAVCAMYRSFVFVRNQIRDLTEEKKVEAKKHLPTATLGKHYMLKSVLGSEVGYQLVRTGTHADGNCFFHAVLTSTSADYRKADSAEKKVIAKKFRTSLSTDLERWLSLGKGSVARLGKPEFPGFDAVFFGYMDSEALMFKGERDKIVAALGPYGLANLISELQKRAYARLSVDEFIAAVKEAFPEYVKFKNYQEAGFQQLTTLLERAKEKAHANFVKHIKACGEWVGEEVLELVSDEVKHDIFILEDTEGAAYPIECAYITGRPTVLILYQGSSHYESVGKQAADGKTVERVFPPNDPLILLIKKKIC